MIAPSDAPSLSSQSSSRASALRQHSHRRGSVEGIEVFDCSSPDFAKDLVAGVPLLGILWKISGIHCYYDHRTFRERASSTSDVGSSAHKGLPWQVKAYRVYSTLMPISYFSNFSYHFFSAGKTHTGVFLIFVLVLVAIPGQLLCWHLHDNVSEENGATIRTA